MMPSRVSVSVVSHGQRDLVAALLSDFNTHCRESVAEILITENIKEGLESLAAASLIPVRIVQNPQPKGFGANHNQAFSLARGNYFCAVNPDIRFGEDPIGRLLACMQSSGAVLGAPRVVDERGAVEDSVRFLPTPFGIMKKALGRVNGLDYPESSDPIFPDWIAGMFLLFRREAFAEVGGFDERYYLYYEDVDICARLGLSGYTIVVCPRALVTHAARRESHRNRRYLRWHLSSMLRFFTSSVYLRYWRLRHQRHTGSSVR